MRQRFIQAVAIIGLLGLAVSARAAELRLEFPDLPRGRVVYAVQSSAADWSQRTNPAASGTLDLADGRAAVTLDLPPGQYGVMAYLDRDADGRLDTLPVGLPTEPYGFSNNVRGRFGPPSWSRARFTLTGSGARQVIRLR